MSGMPAPPASGRAELSALSLPPGEDFFETLAEQLLLAYPALAESGDLSSLRVLVPALPMAVELRAALQRVAQQRARPLLMPHFDTLRNWAATAPLAGVPAPLPQSERLVLLHQALSAKRWFDEAALWGIAAEMAALFDEMSAAALTLPDDQTALAEQLQRAYELRASLPLAFEASVVHELWRALADAAAPDQAGVYRLRLAALASQAQAGSGTLPLCVLLDAAPAEALQPAEQEFLLRYGKNQAVCVFFPQPRERCATPLQALLDAAWPEPRGAGEQPGAAGLPLFERAAALALQYPHSPLADARLRLVPTLGRDDEAQAAVAQIAAWLHTGLRRIAVIAQDRLTARRVRALLEREGVLVSDETGWLLSTSRAAATVDALLETAAGNAYHRDLLDLCKSPYLFAAVDAESRQGALSVLETAIRRVSVKSGLPRMRRALSALDPGGAPQHQAAAGVLLDAVEAATTLLRAKPAPLARWLKRLHKALEVVSALGPLAADAAGTVLLDLLAVRQQELADNAALFSFSAWRDWLNREFEATTFRDSGISSPVVVTALNAVCLRRFEAALLIGGDARRLAPAAHGEFFNQVVRRELGLRTRADSQRELRRDLELLLASVPRVVVSWQASVDGEANLPAPELSLLSTLHQLAWGDDLLRQPLAARDEAPAEAATAPVPTRQAQPSAPASCIPQRISVSAYACLVACPYRFFARHVLGLGEMDEVSEEMAKSDYGELVHRVLERFHGAHALVSALTEAAALAALQECTEAVFAPAVADNFLATAWRLRWEKRLSAYLDWQRTQEAAGWRWSAAEQRVRRQIVLDDGAPLELYGRLDRIDHHDDAGIALFDYKTQAAKVVRERLRDDVQLPAYALMYGEASRAAYVALDDDQVSAVESCHGVEQLAAAATAQEQRLRWSFSRLRGGAPMPAHGIDDVCRWCEMDGLCRRAYT